ncbi:transcriptional regulator NagR [Microbacterium pseudoresistens]|uniref:GntR family transcriptional regulator n=1 Tax=Microbacterium pseudoresistens TaxID=640634 RepID=A0A7Y9ET52_9MICO|nr:GntR family transcriptional regulator [Microbacterium pseudoresistens]NYD53448.1 GntR family transcriptional regulator [Microbacterium pseudoresistens]
MAYKYETVAADIRAMVASSLSPHQAIPSERELEATHGVSRLTIRHAIATLIDEGLLYNVHGSGTFVGSPTLFSKTPKLTSFTEDMKSRGHEASSRLLTMSREPASTETAHALGIPAGTECARLRRLRLADGEPIAVEDVRVPGPLLDIEEFTSTSSLYEVLADAGHEVYRAEQEIKAIALDEEAAHLLRVPLGTPALGVSRVSSDRRGRSIEYAFTLYRADRYTFQLAVTREADK